MKINETKSHPLHCKIENKDGQPLFTCIFTIEPEFSVSSLKISVIVKTALQKLNVTASRRWSGFDFFGLTRSDVIALIEAKQNVVPVENESEVEPLPKILKDVLNVRHRNAGPTSNLCQKAQKRRNELVHELVKSAPFGDFKGEF